MDKKYHNHVQIKVAITLKKLLSENKTHPVNTNDEKEVLKSYESIAIAADLRKATVNDIFNANTKSRIITLIAVVESLGFSMNLFGKIYDAVTEKEIADFLFLKKNKEKQKTK
ncbi:hypothetical protein [Moheibacter sp.]|uniref:hypothetical protein n=1 Tax=Moheibacter sp. TaxID=1965316 RepID=UPI003C7201AB